MVVPQDPRVQLLTGSRHDYHPTSAVANVKGSVYPFSFKVAARRDRGNCWRTHVRPGAAR